ncbi:Acid protease [Mycena kentingensis (nom. inval.)]|nr:Acid protease [Mycena kentingensis (nom. inval.)]
MFPNAALLSLVALALSSCSSAIHLPRSVHTSRHNLLSAIAGGNAEGRTTRNALPLRPRAVFADEDGVFDQDRAHAATVLTLNKHRQNLLNMEANLGTAVLKLLGAVIKPTAVLPRDVETRLAERQAVWRHKRQSEPLVDELNDLEWAGYISIGTPAKDFYIDFDTGSADLWVPSVDCTSDACEGKSKYNVSASSTSKKQNGNFTIMYGDGSSVGGKIYTDVVSVAGVEAPGQYFSAVNELSSAFKGDPIDGILGLAFASISNLNQRPFFNTANANSSLPSNQFSFYLAKNDSELYLGGTNKDRYTGDIEFHDIAEADSGFWDIGDAKIKVDGKSVLSKPFVAIIDSATTIVYGPPDDVETFYKSIPGATLYDSTNGFYSYPCNSTLEVAFSWGTGRDWVVTADNFNLGATEKGSSECIGALSGLDLGLGDNMWLLGDSFMKNVYSVFDFETESIGFAQLA